MRSYTIINGLDIPNPAHGLAKLVRQLHKHGVVSQAVILAARFEGEQVRDLVFIHVVVELAEKSIGQLVEHDGLVYVIPAPGQVGAFAVDVGQLHLVGK